jgi:hypothetical protein
VEHGFLRKPDGSFEVFDFPVVPLDTAVGQINDLGLVAGRYAGLRGYGFITDGDPIFTVDFPNAVTGNAFAINNRGQFGGNYREFLGGPRRAYIATPKVGENPFAD